MRLNAMRRRCLSSFVNTVWEKHSSSVNRSKCKLKGMDMTEDEERKARERDEIAARVAAFRATQEKFKRERDEYFVSTLENARKVERPSLWP